MPFSFPGYSGSLGNCLGWTQEEIGGVLELAQKNVHEKLYEMAELPKLTKKQIGERLGFIRNLIFS